MTGKSESDKAKFEIVAGFCLIMLGLLLTVMTVFCGVPFLGMGAWLCYDGWTKM